MPAGPPMWAVEQEESPRCSGHFTIRNGFIEMATEATTSYQRSSSAPAELADALQVSAGQGSVGHVGRLS